MKLRYRGLNYEHDFLALDMVEGGIGGKYRGQNWTYSYPRHIPVPEESYDLKYRSVAYSTDEVATAVAIARQIETETMSEKLPKPASSKSLVPTYASYGEQPQGWKLPTDAAGVSAKNNLGLIHKANLCKILDRRKQAARDRGDEELLRQLQAESQYIAC